MEPNQKQGKEDIERDLDYLYDELMQLIDD